MKYGIYSYRDVKCGFMPPQCDQNDAAAIRGFSYAVNNNNLMNFAPKDYDLYKVGEFDVEKGIIEALDVPVIIASGYSVYQEE